MATEVQKYFIPVDSLRVPGHGHKTFGQIDLKIPNAPFDPSRIGDLSTVGFDKEQTTTNLFPADEELVTPSPLRKLSESHGRSYEFIQAGTIVWSDEYGNLYTKMNTKGNNLSIVHLHADDPELLYNLHGMQTHSGLARQLEASRIMREAGIETEAITHVIEPLALPIDGKMVPIEVFKRELVKKELMGSENDDPARVQMLQKLADISFFITVRATQGNVRLVDFAFMDSDQRIEALREAFYYTNLYEKTSAKKDPNYTPREFDPENPEDRDYYLHEYLPAKLGTNYAKLHKLGLVHKFTALGNISLSGTIVDLDSIKGFALGDSVDEMSGSTDLRTLTEGLSAVQSVTKIVEDPQRFGTSLRDAYLKESMKKPAFFDIAASNLTDLSQKDSDIPVDFFRYALEHTPIAPLNIPLIIESVKKALSEYSDQEAITPEEEFSIFEDIVCHLVSTNIDKVTRRRCRISRGESKNRLADAMYKFISLKVDKIFDTEKELLLDSFGPEIDPHDINRKTKNTNAFIAASAQVFRDLGWEKDIKSHAFDIQAAFPLEYPNATEYLNRYLNLFIEQTGIEFPWTTTTEEMAIQFQEYDTKRAELLKALLEKDATTLPSDYKPGELESMLATMLPNYNYFQEPFAEDRFTGFVIDTIDNWKKDTEFKEVVLDAVEDAEEAYTITDWFYWRALNETSGELPEDIRIGQQKLGEEMRIALKPNSENEAKMTFDRSKNEMVITIGPKSKPKSEKMKARRRLIR